MTIAKPLANLGGVEAPKENRKRFSILRALWVGTRLGFKSVVWGIGWAFIVMGLGLFARVMFWLLHRGWTAF